jgi:hypothetical protein
MNARTRWWARTTGLWWVAALGLAGLGCASLGVRTDYDREVAFAALRSYAWIDSARVVRDADNGVSPFLERRVRRAVDQGLRGRGFVADSAGTPDFLVTAFVIGPTPEEHRWQYWPAAPCGPIVTVSFGVGYPYGYGLRHPRWPWRSPFFRYPWGYACSYRVGFGYLWLPVYEEPPEHLVGTLVIDILDAGTRNLIWRGSAEGAVLRYPGEPVSQEELDDIATRILREFPPGSRR